MDPRVGDVKREILICGTADWVSAADVAGCAFEAMYGDRFLEGYPDDDRLSVEDLAAARYVWRAGKERKAIPLGIAAVKELVAEGLVRVGYPADHGFVPWEETGDELASRIDAVVEDAEFPLIRSLPFWLENTDRGHQAAEQFDSAQQ